MLHLPPHPPPSRPSPAKPSAPPLSLGDSARHTETDGGTPTSQRSLLESVDESWGLLPAAVPPPAAAEQPAPMPPTSDASSAGKPSPFAAAAGCQLSAPSSGLVSPPSGRDSEALPPGLRCAAKLARGGNWPGVGLQVCCARLLSSASQRYAWEAQQQHLDMPRLQVPRAANPASPMHLQGGGPGSAVSHARCFGARRFGAGAWAACRTPAAAAAATNCWRRGGHSSFPGIMAQRAQRHGGGAAPGKPRWLQCIAPLR